MNQILNKSSKFKDTNALSLFKDLRPFFSQLFFMIKKNIRSILPILALLAIVLSQNCQQYTQTSCQANNCVWSGNSTSCSLGNNSCLTGQVYSEASNSCTSCSTLAAAECSKLCSEFYYSNGCKSCTDVDEKCISCSDANTCNQCDPAFTLAPIGSVMGCNSAPCNITRCTECASDTTCLYCKTQYKPSPDGASCELATCSIEYCLACLDSSACSTCLPGYQLSADGTKCKLICDDPYCDLCQSADSCSQCKDGFNFNSALNLCKLTCKISTCVECDTVSSCRICQTGYQPNQRYTACQPICVDTNCGSCSSPTECTSCLVGFSKATNGTCVRTICSIYGCSVCLSISACNTCGDNYQLVNASFCQGKCVTSTNKCTDCSSPTICSACENGYTLSTAGTECVPLCSIANCLVCFSAIECRTCTTNFVLSSGRLSCLPNCGLARCLTCNSTTTCASCQAPFVPILGATRCGLTCSIGFYLANPNDIVCQLCSSSIPNCNECTLNPAGTLICSSSISGFYLTGSNTCSSCTVIANCVQCLSPKQCTNCQFGYNLVYAASTGYTCSAPPTCTVSNCRQCLSGNALSCVTCNDGYVLNSLKTACTLIVCPDRSVYNPSTKDCDCPDGFYFSNRRCRACNINNCETCDTAGCNTCAIGYYQSEGRCRSCINHCTTCTSGNSCIKCYDGYSYVGTRCKKSKSGEGQDDSGNIYPCPTGCTSCTIKGDTITSCVPADGYSLDASGNLVRCTAPCNTCKRSDASLCTSCLGFANLVGTKCAGCADQFASSCSSDLLYSTACISGYSPFDGKCQACAKNCDNCGVNGAGNCDTCSPGYIVISGTKNCTQCFKGCANCTSTNPSVCSSCGVGEYLDSLSLCASCPSVCTSCTSPTSCSECQPNYILSNNFCYLQLAYPCQDQTANACTQCYTGYTLNNGNCVNQGCNTTSTCVSCAATFYLKDKKCLPCATDPLTCLTCYATSTARCLTCVNGYYVNADKTCSQCSVAMTGCVECSYDSFCTVVAPGYYLVRDGRSRNTGQVQPCLKKCATCLNGIGCITCATGYVKIGGKCASSRNVVITLVVAAGANSPWLASDTSAIGNNTMLASTFLNINQLLSSISVLSSRNSANIIMISLSLGSVVTSNLVEVTEGEDQNQVLSTINTNIASGNLPDFTLLKGNTASSFSDSSNSVNFGLILGLTIPLVILVVFISVLVKVLHANDDKEISEDTQTNKQMQDEDL